MFNSLSIKTLLLNGAALALVAIMLKLGMWQLDRSEFKAEKQVTFNQRVAQPAQELASDLVDAKDWSYYRVEIKGQYLPEKGFFVDNVVNNTVTGLLLVTPLKIANSETLILVNRGWLPWGEDRAFLPIVETPQQQIKLTGLLIPAATGHFYLGNPEQTNEPDNLWLQLDLQRFIKSTDNPVQPLILVLDSGQPGGYEYIWKLQDDNWIARHKAYAVQWFALAATLFLVTLVLNFRATNKGEDND